MSYFPRRPSPSPRRCRNTRSAGMLPRTAAIPRSIAGSRLVSYRGAQGKLTNGIRVDAILGHVSAHGLAICLKSHNAYTSHHYHHHRHHHVATTAVSFFSLDFLLCLFQPFLLFLISHPYSLACSKSLFLGGRCPFSFSHFSSISLLKENTFDDLPMTAVKGNLQAKESWAFECTYVKNFKSIY